MGEPASTKATDTKPSVVLAAPAGSTADFIVGHAVGVAIVTAKMRAAELAKVLGLSTCRGLARRRVTDIRVKVGALQGAQTICRYVAESDRRAMLEAFAGKVSAVFGRRISTAMLRRWKKIMEKDGTVALLDARGRPAGQRAVDVDLLTDFMELIGCGVSVASAHEKIRQRAVADGRAWPANVGTVYEAVRRGKAVVTGAPPASAEERSYLTIGACVN